MRFERRFTSAIHAGQATAMPNTLTTFIAIALDTSPENFPYYTIVIIIRQQSQDLSACMGREQGSGDDAYIIAVAMIMNYR